jgi:hypothetical protein
MSRAIVSPNSVYLLGTTLVKEKISTKVPLHVFGFYPIMVDMENKQMTIPETATKAGTMDGIISSRGISAPQAKRFDEVLIQWQAAANEKHYVTSGFTHPADKVHGHSGAKYARLDIGGSGAFMVEIATGVIYGIMGYGKVDKKKVSGNIYDPAFDGATLVKTQFQYGRFDLRTKAVQ